MKQSESKSKVVKLSSKRKEKEIEQRKKAIERLVEYANKLKW